jgi:hypothetical protein
LRRHLQVYKQKGADWKLQASEGLAVLMAEKGSLMAALFDAKYDKIIHVRQVSQLVCSDSLNGEQCVWTHAKLTLHSYNAGRAESLVRNGGHT